METQQSLWAFVLQHADKLLEQSLTHIGLTFVSLLAAVLIGLPAGILISRHEKLSAPLLGFAGILQTIPSLALLGFMIPVFGIGPVPAIVALFLYALLPIIRNTYIGIKEVDPAVVEAAQAMGMSGGQVLGKVQLPLALPVILAGIRIATVINVGVATLAAYIAAGGLGEFIFGGIALNNTNMILAGAIPAALLAIGFDYGLSRVQKIKAGHLQLAIWVLPAVLLVCASFYLLPRSQSPLQAGFTPEFMGRQDGYLGLKAEYKLDLPTVVISDAVMYKAAYEGKLDVISGYSTDGRLKAYDLVVLQDDKGIFPPYYAAPVVRSQVLALYPELAPALNLLAGQINDSVMTALNYRVDYLRQTPEKVAKDFLVAQGLYRPARRGGKGLVRIGSKIFAEQYILIHMYRMLISGHTNLQVETKTGLGGTTICFEALVNRQIDLYPEYSGTGLLVLLQPTPRQLRELGGDKDRVYAFVKERFDKQYQLTWLQPIGFNNTYALMMRRGQARELGLQSISDLKRYLDAGP